MFDEHRDELVKPHKVEELSNEAMNRLAEYRFLHVVIEQDKARIYAQIEVPTFAHILALNDGAIISPSEKPIPTGDLIVGFGSNRQYEKDTQAWNNHKIERDYNPRQPHSSLGYQSPLRFEAAMAIS